MPPCRIGLDIRMLPNSGIGSYLKGLLLGFREVGVQCKAYGVRDSKQEEERLEAKINNDTTGTGTFPCEQGASPQTIAFNAPIYSISEQLQYPALVRQCQLWHAPHYNVPLWKGKTKLVVTIHDIIHWVFRKQFLTPIQAAYAGFMLRRAVASADHIITVSHHTRKDLIEHFEAPEQKITVIHEAVDETYRQLPQKECQTSFEKIRAKYNIPQSFFLYVGLIKPHKNVLRLVRIFRKLKEQGKVQASLVLIGRKDKAYPKGYESLAKLTTTDDVIYLPEIEPEELVAFYNQTLAHIQPSLYEGFGLTLLEAMACGTPVLTTNSSSIPEVVGDAALRVDAADESGMADAIVRLEQDENLRETLHQKGLERVKLFSWVETARKTAAIYDHVLGKSTT